MRFAIGLPHLDDSPEFQNIDAQIEIAQALEAAGVDACCVTDHPIPILEESGTGHHAWDPFVLLGCVARETTRLGVHSHVVVLPYRNPFIVANAATAVDHAAGPGRFVLGVAAGYLQPEFSALGVDLADRDLLMEDGLQALKHAWSGRPVTMTTSHWSANGNTLAPQPVSSPHPPIWMGGNSRAAIERAVRHCQAWAPFGVTGPQATYARTAEIADFGDLGRRIGALRELCERHERSEPIDICLVRPPTNWGTRLDASRVVDEIGELTGLGVNWVSFRFAARSRSELLEKVAAWGELRSRVPA